MILCRECRKEAGPKIKLEDKDLPSDWNKQEVEDESEWNSSESDGYCDYIDAINGKKCQRMNYRHLNYCYVHK